VLSLLFTACVGGDSAPEPGTTHITASFNRVSAFTNLNVSAAALINITLTISDVLATGTYEDGSTQDISNTLNGLSFDTTRSGVDSTGMAAIAASRFNSMGDRLNVTRFFLIEINIWC